MSSCVITTFPLRQARCRAVRPSPSPQVSLTSSLEPWASSMTTKRKSSSTVARSNCGPKVSSVHVSDAKNNFCSYLALIQRSRSSLKAHTQTRFRLRIELMLGCQHMVHTGGMFWSGSHSNWHLKFDGIRVQLFDFVPSLAPNIYSLSHLYYTQQHQDLNTLEKYYTEQNRNNIITGDILNGLCVNLCLTSWTVKATIHSH